MRESGWKGLTETLFSSSSLSLSLSLKYPKSPRYNFDFIQMTQHISEEEEFAMVVNMSITNHQDQLRHARDTLKWAIFSYGYGG